MNFLLAIASTSPSTSPADPTWITAILFGWLIVSLVVAKSLGAFGSHFIVGPLRVEPEESVWSPVFTFFGGAFLAIFFTSLIARFLPGQGDAKVLVENGLIEALAFVGVVLFTVLFRPDGLRLIGLRPIQIPHGIAMGATTLFIMFPIVMIVGSLSELIMNHFNVPIPTHEVLRSLREGHGKPFIALSIIFAVLGAPLAEELAFRGFLQTVLAQGLHRIFEGSSENQNPTPRARWRWVAIVVTSAVFAAAHKEKAFFLPLFVLAIGLGYLYERSANLWATISAHALFNGLQIVLFLGMTS